MADTNIRKADPIDFQTFNSLWKNMITETSMRGGNTLPGKLTWEFVQDRFSAYTHQREKGVVLLAEHTNDEGQTVVQGGLMWGCIPEPPFISRLGSAAFGWGTFVNKAWRKQGIARALWERAEAELSLKGVYRVVISPMFRDTFVIDALQSWGAKPHEIVLMKEIK